MVQGKTVNCACISLIGFGSLKKEFKMSKKLSVLVIAAVLVLALVVPAHQAFAADLVITATILESLGFEFTPAIDPWTIGNMVVFDPVADPPVAGSIAGNTGTVKNTGSGGALDYCMSLTNPADWSAGDSPGFDTFGLYASFNGDEPIWDEVKVTLQADHSILTTEKCANGTLFVGPDADQTGYNVGQDVTENLWLMFVAPTGTSSNAQQTITFTITAQATLAP